MKSVLIVTIVHRCLRSFWAYYGKDSFQLTAYIGSSKTEELVLVQALGALGCKRPQEIH